MRLFHAKVMDWRLEGDGTLRGPSAAWTDLLVRAEALNFFCVVDQVSGTTPTLTVYLLGAADTAFDVLETTKAVILDQLLNAGTNVIRGTYAPGDPGFPPPKRLTVAAILEGANAMAHVQLWICGRGSQRLEETGSSPGTFASQLAAARMCEDESRLIGRKRALRPGASFFCPPEEFEPSLKWDR